MNPKKPKVCSFVLVHGGFHGGWCWRFVAQALRARGHTVLTRTQTGLGERSQLLTKDITLQNGQTMFDGLPPAAMFNLTEKAHIEFAEAHLTPHPLGTYLSRLNLKHPVGNGRPAVYVQCTEPVFASLKSSRDWVKTHGMRTVQIKTGHDAMISAHGLLTDLLCELAG